MIENMKGELWKRYRDTDYYFSSYGRVKRIYKKSERLLKPYTVFRYAKKLVVKVYGKVKNPLCNIRWAKNDE